MEVIRYFLTLIKLNITFFEIGKLCLLLLDSYTDLLAVDKLKNIY